MPEKESHEVALTMLPNNVEGARLKTLSSVRLQPRTLSVEVRALETLRKIKFDLIEFHEKFDHATREEKIAGMVEIQQRRYDFIYRIALSLRRERFESNIRNRRFLKRDCFVCGGVAQVRHHIIALKQGATNAKRNIVALCRYDHAKIHPWLVTDA